MWAPDGHVSWLEAALTRLPGTPWIPVALPSRRSGKPPGPLTVAGPRRTCTGFRKPPRPNLSCPDDAQDTFAGQLRADAGQCI